ncbi:MAG TPA: class I SAM-dependent methyltransferase [Bacteroidia bacterium]|nr:class I SAM-dependent methyltransferase [Bacteroidia bacterium]
MTLVSILDKRFYPDVSDRWDDLLFREEILRHLQPNMTMLDLGAGAGIVPEMNFKDKAKMIYGLDPDERVSTNPFLDSAVCSTAEEMPFADEMFDIIICQNVIEHIENPERMLTQAKRVLKKGGLFLVKTPNRNHYVALGARLTPLWFHQWYNKLRGRDEEDTFKTFYNFNSKSAQRKFISEAGLETVSISFYEKRPEYLRLNVFTYLLGIAHERAINKLNLNRCKAVMISVFRK